MSMERPDPPLKLCWVTMKMEASYTLLVRLSQGSKR